MFIISFACSLISNNATLQRPNHIKAYLLVDLTPARFLDSFLTKYWINSAFRMQNINLWLTGMTGRTVHSIQFLKSPIRSALNRA